MKDYIFCPLCGSSEWKAHKLREVKEGRLSRYACQECNKFIYTNVQKLVPHELLVGITETCRYSEEVTLEKFYVSTYYYGPQGPVTNIRDSDSMELLLSLRKAPKFNWFKHEESLEKIRKYLLFS